MFSLSHSLYHRAIEWKEIQSNTIRKKHITFLNITAVNKIYNQIGWYVLD